MTSRGGRDERAGSRPGSEEGNRSLAPLPPEIRPLLVEFCDGLKEALEENLVGVYLLGSIVFPGFVPTGDIDFHVVVHRELQPRELQRIRDLHKTLAQRFPHGKLLDGLYLPLTKAQGTDWPRGLVGVSDGKAAPSATDEEWPLHREHIHQGACIVLYGRDPRTIYPSTSWSEIAVALDEQLAYVKPILLQYPFWCVLNLCRLIYTWETRNVATSKVEAADWALVTLPARWHALVRSARRVYRGQEREGDRRCLTQGVGDFFLYASKRIGKAR